MKRSSSVIDDNYQPNYDREPVVAVPGSGDACVAGWDAIATQLRETMVGSDSTVVIVDCYVGVHVDALLAELSRRLQPTLVINSREIFRASDEVDQLVEPFLGDGDPVFGFLCGLHMDQFLDSRKLEVVRERVEHTKGLVLVIGEAASAIHHGDLLVYADMPRWEGQLRQRRNEVSNLGVANADLKAALQYKRSYFVDWRVCDRWKKTLLARADFFLDTTSHKTPKLAKGDVVRLGLKQAAYRPFRVVPFFDPGPWGGQWMRRVCNLAGYQTPEPVNYAWCFDCVPEENSLLLGFGNERFELPSVNAVFRHPRQMLGDPVHARFGDEFPIRFDFLDTMDGGNLSFQVHPLTEFVQEHFGLHYTQDESYYLLDAAPDGTCYLGVKSDADPQQFEAALHEAHQGGAPFDADRFVNRWPAKKHDHFLIPAGTVHCSGANTMVLEISATPYIFTFKLWDWGRMGLDGKPRPINIERGLPNINWQCDADFCQHELINVVEEVATGDGWTEERTGLHRREFIETRRHWFTKTVPHDTGGDQAGSVNVLNLVEGREAVVESPTGAFEPFVVHYAETFIVPASVGRYNIRPHGEGIGHRCATLKASVRQANGAC